MRTYLAPGQELMEVHLERGAEFYVAGPAFMGSSLDGRFSVEWFRGLNVRKIIADMGAMQIWLAHPFGGRILQIQCEEDVWVRETALLGWTPDAREGRRPRGMWIPASAGSTIFVGLAGTSVFVELAAEEGWRFDALRIVASQTPGPITDVPIFWECHANGIREGFVNLVGPAKVWAETTQLDHPKLRQMP